jgi:chromosome segregation protein
MTKILKIVMQGFKSFAKRTEVIFDDKFNCVIGPNGSGKSNVLDAICFVLGKSSAKGLRAEKSANLVYNGGKSQKAATEGKVSIYFDNSKKTFPSEENVIKITRIVKHDGSSKYKINDKIRTRTQVLDTLAIAKINPDGYNIVLQGDIGKFIDASSIEKRKIIEEISGISVFEEKKNKAERELEKVDAKLKEASIVLKERKSYLKDLKVERDQALKYKDLNDKIQVNKASYLKIKIDNSKSKQEEIEKKISKQKEEFDKLQSKIKEKKEKIKENQEKIREISKEVEEKGESDQVSVQKEIEKIRVEIATNKTKIESHEKELVRISNRKNQLEDNISTIESKLHEYKDNLNILIKKIDNREKEKLDIEKKIDEFKKKHKLDSDTESMDKYIDELDTNAEKIQEEIQKLREEQQTKLREKDKIEYEMEYIEDQIKKVEEIEKQHKTEIQDLKNKRNEFKKITLELNKKLDYSSVISARLSKAQNSIHTYREELSKLNARQASMQEKTSGSLAVQKILELKKSEPGIYGTVGELGGVQSKYAMALEVAAGPRVRSIIVKDDAVASKCITFLKQRKLGVATFIPLNKIKTTEINPESHKLGKSNGAYGLAIDIIKFDSKFKKAFNYVFGSTIIVDSVDAARRIGVGKIRMATLTGDLIEHSGAMQGGHRATQNSSGAFKEHELNEAIDKAEHEIGQLESDISRDIRQKKENEEEILNYREQKANLEGEIIKIEKGLHLKSDDLDASLKNKDHLKEKKKLISREIDDVVMKVSKFNKELAQIKIKRTQVKEEVNQLRNPRLIAELNTFDEKRRQLNEEIIQLSSEKKNINTQIDEIFGRDKENSIKVIKDIEKEEKEFSDEIKFLSKSNQELEKTLKEKEKLLEDFYIKFKSLFKERSKYNDENTALEREIDKVNDSSRQVEYKINTLTLERTKFDTQLSTYYEDFAQYQDVKVDTKKSLDDLQKEIKDFEKLRENIGSVNLRALEIYESVEKEYNRLIEKQKTLLAEKDDVISLINEIVGKKKELFMSTFNSINDQFVEIFQKLSSKGEAYLEVENKEDPFEAGMIVRVRLSGTKFMDLRSLSGGEKTLTTLAFLFAIQDYEPATFYVMDEVDAALDKRNAEKLSELINQYSSKAQYVIISHNDAVITEASTLYGVSMDEHGMSKVVSLKI